MGQGDGSRVSKCEWLVKWDEGPVPLSQREENYMEDKSIKGKSSSKGVRLVKRLLMYLIGLFVLAFGVSFSINSNLGVTPVSSLPYVISKISGVSMGLCVTLIYAGFVLVQIIILRKDFKLIDLGQVIFAGVFGYFVDFGQWILGGFTIPTYVGSLVMLTISIILVAIGVSLYMAADLLNMPMEGMVSAVNQKIIKKLSFGDVKVILDTIVVAFSLILSLLFLGGIQGVREGTVLSALLVGKVMKKLDRGVGFLVPKKN